MRKRWWLISFACAAAYILLILVATGCQTNQNTSGNPSKRTLTVYGFSVEEEVMMKEIFPAFASYWQQQTGEQVIFRSVFTGSEEIVEAIMNGAPVDVAILSNEQHALWLHVNDYANSDWRTFPYEGVLSHSPLIIVVRPGNPLNIHDWTDLARPDVRLVHANPRTSGGAQWALLAEYGSAFLVQEDQLAAQKQVREIWDNVIVSPSSSREALEQFLFGVGDALVTYEQDALLAQSRGAAIEIVTPQRTIISEHMVIIVERNVGEWELEFVNAFVSFLWTAPAQEAFGRYYFRPVTTETVSALAVSDQLLAQNPSFLAEIEQLFTVDDLGGWGWAYAEVIQKVWEEQIAPH